MTNLGQFLESVPAFKNFDRAEIDALERAMAVENFPDGHVFTREGEKAERMYLVIDGEVVVSRRRLRERGYDQLNTIRVGELFGLVSLIGSCDHSATCTANGPVTVAYLPRSAFDLLFKAHARIGNHFQLLIAQQLVHDMRAYTALLIGKLLSREQQTG